MSPSPLRKEQADSSDPQNWQQPGGSNSSGSLLGGDGDLVDGSQADGGDASVINIGEPGTGVHLYNNNSHSQNSKKYFTPGLPRSASTSSGSRMAAGKGADLRRSESAKDGESKLRRNGRRKGSNPELPSGKSNPSRSSSQIVFATVSLYV